MIVDLAAVAVDQIKIAVVVVAEQVLYLGLDVQFSIHKPHSRQVYSRYRKTGVRSARYQYLRHVVFGDGFLSAEPAGTGKPDSLGVGPRWDGTQINWYLDTIIGGFSAQKFGDGKRYFPVGDGLAVHPGQVDHESCGGCLFVVAKRLAVGRGIIRNVDKVTVV